MLNGAVDENNRLQIKSVVLRIILEDFGVNLDNVLNEDPALSESKLNIFFFLNFFFLLEQTAQMFLNTANKQDLIRMGVPYLESKCSEVVMEMCNDILKNLNYDDLFPV